jgi:hypothetical protein
MSRSPPPPVLAAGGSVTCRSSTSKADQAPTARHRSQQPTRNARLRAPDSRVTRFARVRLSLGQFAPAARLIASSALQWRISLGRQFRHHRDGCWSQSALGCSTLAAAEMRRRLRFSDWLEMPAVSVAPSLELHGVRQKRTSAARRREATKRAGACAFRTGLKSLWFPSLQAESHVNSCDLCRPGPVVTPGNVPFCCVGVFQRLDLTRPDPANPLDSPRFPA